MRRARTLLICSAVLALLIVSAVSAEDRNNAAREDREKSKYRHEKVHDHGFHGKSGKANITGSLAVTEKGITLSLVANPNSDVTARANDNRKKLSEANSIINITLYALVEYEDSDNNGYDSNNTVVSKYSLNSSTLNPLTHSSNDTHELYVVETEDGVFRMDIAVNKSSTAGIEWKWSVTLDYNFQSSSSSIAMLHDFESSDHKMHEHKHKRNHSNDKREHEGRTCECTQAKHEEGAEDRKNEETTKEADKAVDKQLPTHRYNNNSLIKRNGKVPFFFKWIKTAQVDGVTQNITATSNIETFAISIPQGEHIYYDPSIGVEQAGLEEYNSYLSSVGETLHVVFSPMVITIFVAVALVVSITGVTFLRKRN